MQIDYKEMTSELLEKIIAEYGSREERYSKDFETTIREHIHFEDGSYSVAALHDGKPVGFISAYTKSLAKPLQNEKDAYIDILEVDINYRRQGIAKDLVKQAEEWVQRSGYSQIRSWSSEDKTEAIPMWYSLGYCVCPAKIWVEWCKEVVDGYYVAKKFNTTK